MRRPIETAAGCGSRAFKYLLWGMLSVIQMSVPALRCSAADLSSPVATQSSPASATIRVGGVVRSIHQGQLVTPSELAAINQVLHTGRQQLLIGSQGQAIGGLVNLGSDLAGQMQALTIPKGVVGFNQFTAGRVINFTGDINNGGIIYGYATNPATNAAIFQAASIINAPGALITTLGSSIKGLVPAGIAGLNLQLNAVNQILNEGTIQSAGALSLRAGTGVLNDGTASGGSARIEGAGNVKLATSYVLNSGLIKSDNGNISVAPADASDVLIDNRGGTINAPVGALSVRNENFTAAANLTLIGGNILSSAVNLYSGTGTVNVNVQNISAPLNIQASEAHVAASTDKLLIGNVCLTGDPTFFNTAGSIQIVGDLVFAGAPLAIVASQDITTGPGAGIISTASSTGSAGPITLIAGANLTSNGASSANNDTTTSISINGASPTGGKIDLVTGTPVTVIDASSTSTGNGAGGHITMVALQGAAADSGRIIVDAPILARGRGTSTSGAIDILAGATTGIGIDIGDVANNGAKNGSAAVHLQTNFSATTPVFITNGAITSGSFTSTALTNATGSIVANDITTNGSSVTISGKDILLNNLIIDASGGVTGPIATINSNSKTPFVIGPGALTNGVKGALHARGLFNGIQGGTIRITNAGYGGIQVDDPSVFDVSTANANAGWIALLAPSGILSIAGGTISANANGNGKGGEVSLSALQIAVAGNTPLQIQANGSGTGSGGDISISITCAEGDIVVGTNGQFTLTANAGSSGGSGGSVDLLAGRNIVVGMSAVQLSPGGNNGGGGTFWATSGYKAPGGITVTGDINLDGIGNGAGGEIELTAFSGNQPIVIGAQQGGSFVSGSLSARGAGTGAGGQIQIENLGSGGIVVSDPANINVATTGGAGGRVVLDSAMGTVPGPLTIGGGAISVSGGGSASNGGTLTIRASEILLPGNSALSLSANGSGTGNGGSVSVTTLSPGAGITVGNGGGQIAISATGGSSGSSGGNGGTVTLTSAGDLQIAGSSLTVGPLGINGNGAHVVLSSGQNSSLFVDGNLSVAGMGVGVSTPAQSFTPSPGIICACFTTMGPSSIVSGGTLTINNNSPMPFMIGPGATGNGINGQVDASAGSSGDAGTISVANTGGGGIAVNQASSLRADSTSGTGGAIMLDAASGIAGPVSFTGGGTMSASALTQGAGGSIEVKGTRLTTTGPGSTFAASGDGFTGFNVQNQGGVIGLISTDSTAIQVGTGAGQFRTVATGGAQSSSTSTGGKVFITSGGALTVDPAGISVQPLGTNGNAGSITLTAGTTGAGDLYVTSSLLSNGVGTGFGGLISLTNNSGNLFTIGPGTTGAGVNGTISAGALAVHDTVAGGGISVPNLSSIPASGASSITLETVGNLTIGSGALSAKSSSTGGTLTLTGRQIDVIGGGGLALDASGTGAGNGGKVTVTSLGPNADLFFGSGPGQISIVDTGGSAGSATGDGGTVTVSAGGNVGVAANSINGSPLGTNGKGAGISIVAGTAGDGHLTFSGTTMDANGHGNLSGGTILLQSNSADTFVLGPSATVNGTTANLTANAGASAGTGGSITVRNVGLGGTQIESFSLLSANPSVTGLGGTLTLDGGAGSLSVPSGTLTLNGAGTGSGGKVTLSGSAIAVVGVGPLSIVANGSASGAAGGTIVINATGATSDLTVGSGDGQFTLAARSGPTTGNGGSISVSAGRNLTVSTAQISAQPAGVSGFGGVLSLNAGTAGAGDLSVSGSLTTNGLNGKGGSVTLTSNSSNPFSVGAGATANGVSGSVNTSSSSSAAGSINIVNYGSGGITIPVLSSLNNSTSSSFQVNLTLDAGSGDLNLGSGTLSIAGSGGSSVGTLLLRANSINVTGGSLTLRANGGTIDVGVSGSTSDIMVGGLAGQMQMFGAGTVNVTAARHLIVDMAYLSNPTTLNLRSGSAGPGDLNITGNLNASNLTLTYNDPVNPFVIGGAIAHSGVSGSIVGSNSTTISNAVGNALSVQVNSSIAAAGTSSTNFAQPGQPVTIFGSGTLGGRVQATGSSVMINLPSSSSDLILRGVYATTGDVNIDAGNSTVRVQQVSSPNGPAGSIPAVGASLGNVLIKGGNVLLDDSVALAADVGDISLTAQKIDYSTGQLRAPSGTVTLSASGTGDAYIGCCAQNNAFTVTASELQNTIAKNLVINAGGNVNVRCDVDLSGASNPSNLTLVAGGNINIDGSVKAASITLAAPSGSIAQASGTLVAQLLTVTFSSSASPVTLSTDVASLKTTGGSSLLVQQAGDIELLSQNVSSLSVAAHNISLTTSIDTPTGLALNATGAINPAAGVIISGGNLNLAFVSGPLTLSTNVSSLISSAPGQSLTINEADGIQLNAQSGASLTVNAGLTGTGDLTTSGNLVQTGNLNLTNASGKITISNPVTALSAGMRTSGNYDIEINNVLSASDVTLQSGGNVTQSASGGVVTPALTVDTSSGASVTLGGNSNNVGKLTGVGSTGGSIALNNGSNNISLDTFAPSGTQNVAVSTAGAIDLLSDINVSSLSLKGGTLTVNKNVSFNTAASFTIAGGGTATTTGILNGAPGSTLSLTAQDNSSIHIQNSATAGTVNITVGAGSVADQTTGGQITAISQVNATANGGTVDMTAAMNSTPLLIAKTTGGGVVTWNNGSAPLTLNIVNGAADSGTFGMVGTGTLTVGALQGDNVTLSSSGSIVMGDNGSSAGALSITAPSIQNDYALSGKTIFLETAQLKGVGTYTGSSGINIGTSQQDVSVSGPLHFVGDTTINASDHTVEVVDPNVVHVNGSLIVNALNVINPSGFQATGTTTINLTGAASAFGTIENLAGAVTLASNTIVNANGKNLAIIASGGVIADGVRFIDLSGSTTDGGTLSIYAGVRATRPSPVTLETQTLDHSVTFSILGPSSTGGSINLSNVSITTGTTAANHSGGDIVLFAAKGTDSAGVISVGSLDTRSTSGAGGNVIVSAAGGIAVGGSINTSGATSAGAITLDGGVYGGNFATSIKVLDAQPSRLLSLNSSASPVPGAAVSVVGPINGTSTLGAGAPVHIAASNLITLGTITTSGALKAGDVNLSSVSGYIETKQIATTGLDAAGAQLNGGAGGAVSLSAPSFLKIGGNIVSSGGNASGGADAGKAGNISLVTTDSNHIGTVSVGGFIDSRGGAAQTGTGGAGGNVTINSGNFQVAGSQSVGTAFASIIASGGAGGTAGTDGAVTIDTYATQTIPSNFALISTTKTEYALPGAVIDVGSSAANGTAGAIISGSFGVLQQNGVVASNNGTVHLNAHGGAMNLTEGAAQVTINALKSNSPYSRTRITAAEALALYQLSTGNLQTLQLDSAKRVTGSAASPSTITIQAQHLQPHFSYFDLRTTQPDALSLQATILGANPIIDASSAGKVNLQAALNFATPASVAWINAGNRSMSIPAAASISSGTGGAVLFSVAGMFANHGVLNTLPVIAQSNVTISSTEPLNAIGIAPSPNVASMTINSANIGKIKFADTEYPSGYGKVSASSLSGSRAKAISVRLIAPQNTTTMIEGSYFADSINLTAANAGIDLSSGVLYGNTRVAINTTHSLSGNTGLVSESGTVSVNTQGMNFNGFVSGYTGVSLNSGSQPMTYQGSAYSSRGNIQVRSGQDMTIGGNFTAGGFNGIAPNFVNSDSTKRGNIAITAGGGMTVKYGSFFNANGNVTAQASQGNVTFATAPGNLCCYTTWRATNGNLSILASGDILQGSNIPSTPAEFIATGTGPGQGIVLLSAGSLNKVPVGTVYSYPAGTRPPFGAIGSYSDPNPTRGVVLSSGGGSVNVSNSIFQMTGGAVVFQAVPGHSIVLPYAEFAASGYERPIVMQSTSDEEFVVDVEEDYEMTGLSMGAASAR